MLKQIATSLFGTRHAREMKRVQPIVDAINEEYERLHSVSEDELRGQTAKLRAVIAERAKTGEGKTLVATLPLYLNALAGRGAHLVTVNSYLARRDSQWMGHLYSYLGLTVGCIDDTEPNTEQRKAAYLCDITYGTNNEFGFDY